MSQPTCARCGERPAVLGRPGVRRCEVCAAAPRYRSRHRRRTTPRARTLNLTQLRAAVWRENQATPRTQIDALLEETPRPTIRAECEPCSVCQAYLDHPTADAVLACGHPAHLALNHCRPCVRVGCRYSTFLEVNPDTGSIKFNHAHADPTEIEHSCALDVADEGPHILEEVATISNVTRERLRQIEAEALMALARFRRRLR